MPLAFVQEQTYMMLRDLIRRVPAPMLRINVPGIGPRLVGHLIPLKGEEKWVMVDPGWYGSIGSQPVHILSGDVRGAGPWHIGPVKVEEVAFGDVDYIDALRWQDYAIENDLWTKAREMLVTLGYDPA